MNPGDVELKYRGLTFVEENILGIFGNDPSSYVKDINSDAQCKRKHTTAR
jgi:hypothetical protein